MPKGIHNVGPFERRIRTPEAFAANDRGIGHDFWLFHGINYLSGNPFPGIYKGETIYRGALFSHILAKHMDGNNLTERGRGCLIWVSMTAREMYRAVEYVKTFALKYKRNPLLPDDPYLLVSMEAMAGILVEAVDGWSQTDPLPTQEYYFHHRRFDWDIRRAARNVLRYDPRTRHGWEFWAGLHRKTIARLGMPPGVKPFRMEYRERNDRGYLVQIGWLEDRRKGSAG